MFSRDIVVFDVESTDLDIERGNIIQIAAVLLDKETLEEIRRFSSYIAPVTWDNWLPEAMEVNKITKEQLVSAPSLEEILPKFEEVFPPESTLLAAYNAWFDTGFLRQAFMRIKGGWPYEFHTFDIWALAYYYWCNSGPHTANPKKPIGFGLSDMAELLGIPPFGTYHEAMADVEAEAEVLRRLVSKLKLI